VRHIIDLKAEDLTKLFGKVVALNGINFHVSGEIIAVVGPNGSGKSTLLSIIAGLRRPSKGKLFLNGVEPYRRREEVFGKIAFSFEKPRFNIDIRVRDVIDTARNICYDSGGFLSGVESLGLLKLSSRRLYELSSGQAQLLSLALTLFCDTKSVALLDEPLAHLDINYQGLILEHVRRRKNVVFTTHVLEEAEVAADKILVLNSGRIKWVGDAEKLYSENMYEVIVPRRNMEKFESLLRSSGGELVTDFGVYILVRGVAEEKLIEFFREKIIIGYRRAGLRVRIHG